MDTNVRIIAEVSKYDCLYNKDSESYTNFEYKKTLWKSIGSELGIPGEEVKRKFRSFRDVYTKYIKKLKENPDSDPLPKPYRYAQYLTFLNKHLPTAEITTSHISESSLDITADYCSDLEVSFFKKRKLEPEYIDESSQDPFELTNNTANFNDSQRTESISAKDFQFSDRCSKRKDFTQNSSPCNSELVSTSKRKKEGIPRNCTMELFKCLANKIGDSNLTEEQKNDIESSVCKLVYSKIIEYT